MRRFLFTSIVIIFCLSWITGCGIFSSQSSIKLEWNLNQIDPIIQATFCCGFVTQIVPLNYIPDAQIWGDGRYIWVENRESGQRIVHQSQLTQAQLQETLQSFVKAGYFQWKDEYADNTISDMPWQCLHVKLIAKEKSVCEYYRGAPEAFHALYNQIWSGMGKVSTDFAPAQGFLTSFPISSPDPPNGTTTLNWPSRAKTRLRDAMQGAWVEGDALQFAWKVVNNSPWGSFIEEYGMYYQLALQIPGVSMIEPPAH
ncbi:hypothetical protein HY229_05300 [Candidatus Acetothermia bacterium]|nr:hypothetical protein [Candidatus Acetothermia bacterium]MBI3643500.1 hypothetical protein [Candidatus Acetothermia bacterium]